MQDSKPKTPEQQAQERVAWAQEKIVFLKALIQREPDWMDTKHYCIAWDEIRACEKIIQRHGIRAQIERFSA